MHNAPQVLVDAFDALVNMDVASGRQVHIELSGA
jgi:hypothetical protein